MVIVRTSMGTMARMFGVAARRRPEGPGLSQCLSQSLGQTKTPFVKPCPERLCERRLVDERRGQESAPEASRRCSVCSKPLHNTAFVRFVKRRANASFTQFSKPARHKSATKVGGHVRRNHSDYNRRPTFFPASKTNRE